MFYRGAAHVLFVERSAVAARELRRLLEDWRAVGGDVQHDDALRLLSTPPEPFDIVFLDPPFSTGVLEESTARLHDEVRHDPLDRVSTESDAEDLARAAVDFRRAVERNSPREDLEAAFARIAQPYHALREHYAERAADPVVRDRFQDVAQAYADVEGALQFRLSQFSSPSKVR